MRISRSGQQWLAATGAVFAALGVALAAYASHAAAPDAHARLQLAAAIAFGHGVAIAALAPHTVRRLGRFALHALAAGVLLFSGSLTAHALAGVPTALAPVGGMLLIAGWLLHALEALTGTGDA